MKRLLIACSSSVAVVLCATAIALACRVVDDKRPSNRPNPSAIVHKEFKVDVKVRDQVAEVVVSPTFHNPHDFPIEGSYFLSLPAGAQIKAFSMTTNGKEHKAELLDAAKARQAYNNLVRTNADPAILELVGSQMMRTDLAPIPAKGDVAIKVSYTTLLENTGGIVQLDIPFTNQFGGDYSVPLVSVNVDLGSKIAMKNIYSPTHSLDVTKKGDNSAKIAYEATNYSARKSFKLFYQLSDDDLGLTLLTYREAGKDGFFCLMASPKVEIDPSKVLPKDVVFVMDRSGSMSGPKIQQAREALVQGLGALKEKDRFGVIAFSSEVDLFDKEMVEATKENLARATRYVEGIKAAGSTNLNDSLDAAFTLLGKEPMRMPMILYCTDGLPTVGEQDMNKILANAKKRNPDVPDQARVFVFGVGNDVNTQFIDRLAEEHRGARDYVAPEEKIEVKLGALMDKLSSPVLSNLAIDLGGIKMKDLHPRRLPDLFKGSQLVLFGRYEGEGPTTLTLKGAAAGQEKIVRFDINLPAKDAKNDFIPRLWAARKVAFLIDSIRLSSGPASKEIVDEVVALGKQYGIVTPYTSFLITEDRASGSAPGKAAGDEMNALRDKAEKSGRGDPKAPAADAQGASRKLKEDRDTGNSEALDKKLAETKELAKGFGGGAAARALKTGVRSIGTKTFFLREGTWTDSEFDSDKMKEIVKSKFMSDAYFKLLEDQPELAKYFALGESLVVVYEAKVYAVEPLTEEKK